jgi:hypothetical protein
MSGFFSNYFHEKKKSKDHSIDNLMNNSEEAKGQIKSFKSSSDIKSKLETSHMALDSTISLAQKIVRTKEFFNDTSSLEVIKDQPCMATKIAEENNNNNIVKPSKTEIISPAQSFAEEMMTLWEKGFESILKVE